MQEPGGETAELSRPTVTRRIAALLPHIGWTKSQLVEKRFGTVYNMVHAAEHEWLDIEGIGPKIARDVQIAIGRDDAKCQNISKKS